MIQIFVCNLFGAEIAYFVFFDTSFRPVLGAGWPLNPGGRKPDSYNIFLSLNKLHRNELELIV